MSTLQQRLADNRGTSTIQYAFLAAGLAASVLVFSEARKELQRDTSTAVPQIGKLMPAE